MPTQRAALLLLAASVLGCGGDQWASDRPEVVAVSGRVEYNQKPLEGATVNFYSKESEVTAWGRTDAEGRFTLTTYEARDGAVPGTHKVAIRKVQQQDQQGDDNAPPPDEVPPKPLIPERYGNAEKSGLTADVVKGESNDFTFELKD